MYEKNPEKISIDMLLMLVCVCLLCLPKFKRCHIENPHR